MISGSMLTLYNFLFLAASEVRMDGIKFPKNFDLSRENMHAIFDAFGDGRSVTEIAAELAQAASSKKISRPPVKASSRTSKPSSRSTKLARSSSHGGSSSTSTLAEGFRSVPASSEVVRETSLAVVEQTQATGQVGQGAVRSTEEALGGKFKSPVEDKEISRTGMEIVLLEDQSPEVSGEGAPAPVMTEPEGSEGVPSKTGGKRPTPSGTPVPSPARKKSRTAVGPSPPLPPIGKGKGISAVPSSSPTDNILDLSSISLESPASAVAALLRERMFGGITEASDPRLLALTGHLASSTKEQVSFQSRSREELGSTIGEMLLMVSYFFHLSLSLLCFFS